MLDTGRTRHPEPRDTGLEQGLDQQQQLWGSESEICERNLRSGQSAWRRQAAPRADGGVQGQEHSPVLTQTSADQNQREIALAKFSLPSARHLLTGPWHSSLPGCCWLCWGTALGYLSTKHPHAPKTVIALIHRKHVKDTREIPEITKVKGRAAICRACPSPG